VNRGAQRVDGSVVTRGSKASAESRCLIIDTELIKAIWDQGLGHEKKELKLNPHATVRDTSAHNKQAGQNTDR